MQRLFVGDLPYDMTEAELEFLFVPYRGVHPVIVRDHDTGKPRGFAFVSVPEEEAKGAIKALDGSELRGRRLTVQPARERGPRAGLREKAIIEPEETR